MKRLRPLPIRWRLTAWYGTMLVASFALLGLALYVGLRILLTESLHEQLDTQADLVVSALESTTGPLSVGPSTQAAFSNDERFLRLFDATSALTLDTSTSVGDVPFDEHAVQVALAGETTDEEWRVDGVRFGVTTRPVVDGAAIVGAAQVGISFEDIDETLNLVLIALLIAIPIALALATLGGYIAARRSLAPVATITAHAAAIGADDLAARLDLELPDDELGRLAQTFDAMLARIEEQVERQRRFTGDAAHELRTPVAAMRAEVDLALAHERSPEEYRSALEGLDHDLERVTALLAALLLLSRSDAGHLSLDRVAFDLAGTIASVIEHFAATATDHSVSLRSDAIPSPVTADEDLIVHLLVNLVENALAHTPAGGEVTLGSRPAHDNTVLWVADTGSGIPTEHLPHILDRFYRVDDGRSRDRGGAGLGLSICRAIVEAHGGTIEIASDKGKGTRVEITLPS